MNTPNPAQNPPENSPNPVRFPWFGERLNQALDLIENPVRFPWFGERLNQALDLIEIPYSLRPAFVAESCGVSLTTALRYLAGFSRPNPSPSSLDLAQRLQVAPEWLFIEESSLCIETARVRYLLDHVNCLIFAACKGEE